MSKLLSNNKVNEKMNLLSKNWSIDGLFLKGSFEFKNFEQAFNFMKVVAIKCEEINHHPKWTNVYNKLDIELFTHDKDGLTMKDFDLAMFMDEEFKKYE